MSLYRPNHTSLNGKSNMKIIRPDIIDDLWTRSLYTPDTPDLQMYENHLVFLFDGLKQSVNPHHNQIFLRDSKYLGRAFTKRKEFIMKQSGIPIVQIKKQANLKRCVFGEVYAVSTNTMMRLDALYDNNNRSNRITEYVDLVDQVSPTKKLQHPTVLAYMYIGSDYFWDKEARSWQPGKALFRQDYGWAWEFDSKMHTTH